MRTFFEKLIPQMGKIPCRNVMNILTELQNIVGFVKIAFSDAGVCQMAPSALLQYFLTTCLRTFIYTRTYWDQRRTHTRQCPSLMEFINWRMFWRKWSHPSFPVKNKDKAVKDNTGSLRQDQDWHTHFLSASAALFITRISFCPTDTESEMLILIHKLCL